MSICRQHEQRDPIGDVSELLRPLRFERAPGPKQQVTPDQYRQWQEQRAAEGVAGVQAKGHVNKPHVPRPAAIDKKLDPIVKFPSRTADAIGRMVPDAIKNQPVGYPAFGTIGGITRGASDMILGTSPDDANLRDQAINAALLGIPGAKAVGVAGKAAGRALGKAAQVVARDGVAQAVKDAYAAVRRKLPKRSPAPKSGQAPKLEPKTGPAVEAARVAEQAAAKPRGWKASIGRGFDNLQKLGWASAGISAGVGAVQHLTGVGSSIGKMVEAAFKGAFRPETKLLQPPAANEPIRQPNGAAPGNDADGNALPGVRPAVPHRAETAKGIGALNALGNDSDMNELRAEYAGLQRKVRMLQDRRLPPAAGMRPDEIARWSELNGPDFRTEGGVSIFEGRR